MMNLRFHFNSKKVFFGFVGIAFLVGFYLNIRFLTGDADSGLSIRPPFIYDAAKLLQHSYRIIDESEPLPSNWNLMDFKSEDWQRSELGKSELKGLVGYKQKSGLILHRLLLTVPEALVQLQQPMALMIPTIGYKQFRISVNGRTINESDGGGYPDSIGVIPILESDIKGSKGQVLIGILGDFRPQDLGLSYYVKTLLGVKKEFRDIYLSDERAANTKYNVILAFKAGLLLFFIILVLVTRYQYFMNFFLIYAIGNTAATFFVISKTSDLLSLNTRAFWMFNLQSIGYAALWFFVEALYEKRISWYKMVLFSQWFILNVFLIGFSRGLWGIDLRFLFQFHNYCLSQILFAVATLGSFMYWKKPSQNVANFPSAVMAFVFVANFLLHLWIHFLAKDMSNNSHQLIDILFFIFVGFLAASEFLLNQLKVQELRKNIEDQAIKVELGQSATRLAHDIRTPFNSLRMAMNSISAHQFDPEFTKTILKSLGPAIDYGEKLAKNILLSQKNEIIQLKPCMPTDVVVPFLQMEANKLNREKIDFKILDRCRNPFLGDATFLLSILQNLVGNATEAFSENQTEKSITCIFEDFTDSMGVEKCRFSLRNNGPKIPQFVLSQLFKKQVTYGKNHGTGLGLAGVKAMIDQMNGEIRVYNLSAAQGVCFEMEFYSATETFMPPPSADESVQSPLPENLQKPSRGSTLTLGWEEGGGQEKGRFKKNEGPEQGQGQGQGEGQGEDHLKFEIKKIIVLDDNPLVRMAWELNWPPAEIFIFDSPEKLFIEVEQNRINLEEIDWIITDYHFDSTSKLTGRELAIQMRKHNFNRIILCSGLGDGLDESLINLFARVIDKKVYSKGELRQIVEGDSIGPAGP